MSHFTKKDMNKQYFPFTAIVGQDAMKQALMRANKSGIKGIKTQVSGRLGGADIARREKEAELAKAAKDEAAGAAPDIDPELLSYINSMIEARRAAKKEKNFAEADRIRDELLSRGITLLDTREGSKFTITE